LISSYQRSGHLVFSNLCCTSSTNSCVNAPVIMYCSPNTHNLLLILDDETARLSLCSTGLNTPRFSKLSVNCLLYSYVGANGTNLFLEACRPFVICLFDAE